MNTNLLKEAIAEADAIKKMAIENAKSSLNEAFDSKIKSMMAARLEEEADDLDLEEEYEEGYDDDQDEAKHSEEEGMKDKEMEEEYGKEEEADEAFSLDAILAELEKDEMKKDEKVMEKKGGDDEDGAPAEEEEDDEPAEEEAPKKKKGDDEDDMDEEIDIAALLAEMDDEMEDDDDKKMEKEGKDPEKEDEDDMKSLEEEMMSLLERMKKDKMAKADKMKKKEEDEKPESKELQEIRRQAAELAQKVNETNLINAKLLYLNKILRKYNLSEQQKIKVISAFDKAETVNESRIVHESLDQAFSVKNDNVKSGLKESIGFASSAAGTSTKRVINEGVVGDVDKQVSRWQKLAGIIK